MSIASALQEARDELAQLQKEAESLQGKLDAASAGKAEELQQLQKQLDAASAGKSEEVQQLRKQLDAQSMELDMARQNADVMREALQVATLMHQISQAYSVAANFLSCAHMDDLMAPTLWGGLKLRTFVLVTGMDKQKMHVDLCRDAGWCALCRIDSSSQASSHLASHLMCFQAPGR